MARSSGCSGEGDVQSVSNLIKKNLNSKFYFLAECSLPIVKQFCHYLGIEGNPANGRQNVVFHFSIYVYV